MGAARIPRAGAASPQSAISQAFLGAILISTFFSLTLNVYLAGRLGVMQDFQSLENDLKASFHNILQDSPAGAINSAADHPVDGMHSNFGNNPDLAIPERGEGHQLAGLNCDKFGGPSEEAAQEMVYWEDIPSDASWVSPFKQNTPQYLTFEPDNGGW